MQYVAAAKGAQVVNAAVEPLQNSENWQALGETIKHKLLGKQPTPEPEVTLPPQTDGGSKKRRKRTKRTQKRKIKRTKRKSNKRKRTKRKSNKRTKRKSRK